MNSIKIGGQERPVNVGWDMLKAFGKRTGRTFGQVFEIGDLSFEDIEALLYEALFWGAKEQGKELNTNPIDVANWISKDMKVVTKFLVFFGEEISRQMGEDEKN